MILVSEPLPECYLCEAPTKRDVWEANGGICTLCRDGVADTVKMLPVGGRAVPERDRRDLLRARSERLEDSTVYVERYVPPVPGQLELGEEAP